MSNINEGITRYGLQSLLCEGEKITNYDSKYTLNKDGVYKIRIFVTISDKSIYHNNNISVNGVKGLVNDVMLVDCVNINLLNSNDRLINYSIVIHGKVRDNNVGFIDKIRNYFNKLLQNKGV